MRLTSIRFLAVAILIPSLFAQTPLQLSLKQAVDMALAPDGNTRVKLAEEAIQQAEARSAEAREWLPPRA
jgi:hypothetical protein